MPFWGGGHFFDKYLCNGKQLKKVGPQLLFNFGSWRVISKTHFWPSVGGFLTQKEGPRPKLPGRLDLCRRTQAGGGRALRLLSRQVGEDRRSKQAGTVELQVAALPGNPLELSIDTSMTLYSFINLNKIVHIACTLLFTRHIFLWQGSPKLIYICPFAPPGILSQPFSEKLGPRKTNKKMLP